MWTKVIEAVATLVSFVSEWLRERRIRRQVALEAELAALRAMEVANEIDKQDTPTDPAVVLGGLRSPGSPGANLGQANLLQ
jgi:hypothetical protein